jgi:hypothetical protein
MCAFSTILGVLVAMLVHLLTQLLATRWGLRKTCEHIRTGFLLVRPPLAVPRMISHPGLHPWGLV